MAEYPRMGDPGRQPVISLSVAVSIALTGAVGTALTIVRRRLSWQRHVRTALQVSRRQP